MTNLLIDPYIHFIPLTKDNMKAVPTLRLLLMVFLFIGFTSYARTQTTRVPEKTRVIVTSDGEIDDQCSMVRFLLYVNEWEVEAIITSSSQYHWQGHSWPGDDWIDPYLEAYAQVYPNLLTHDPDYPAPEFLRERTLLGNVKTEGEMDEITPGSERIVKVMLDESDMRPVWLQAWGGTNTIARALKTIEEKHPEKMAEVAKKMRFFFIWEQDSTYQSYIRPHWGKYEIPTIISDQFEGIAYRWKQVQPKEMQPYFEGTWMKQNILEDHGPLCSLYKAHENGDFRSEGDSPAFLHTIETGLRSLESPDWGGWGGRYVQVRENTWLDPVPVAGYAYPEGRWYGSNGWGRSSLREGTTTTAEQRQKYFKPMWRWTDAMQKDFASRADWCVKSYEETNHPPTVKLGHELNLTATVGDQVKLSAEGSTDPDGDKLSYQWFYDADPSTFTLPAAAALNIQDADKAKASFVVPTGTGTMHIILAVTDHGIPELTRYKRVIVEIGDSSPNPLAFPGAEGYGKYTVGGRGGDVYEVTNLNDAGEGSLRAAVEASGPRTVVFRVSGTIDLQRKLKISHPYLTIAGQTAPGDGITLKRYPLIIGADEVIIRYLRVRFGDESGDASDAISSRYTKNIILDHVSASWSVDETMSIYHCDSITVQWCLIAESMSNSKHGKGSHGFGGIWGANNSSYHHNLLAHHSSRNPRFASGCGHTDYRNNVLYNWGYQSCYGGEKQQKGNPTFHFSTINMVANYYKPGPATQPGEVSYRIASPSSRNGTDDYGQWYIAENVVEGNASVSDDNWNGGVQPQGGAAFIEGIKLDQPWPSMPIAQQTAVEAYASVLRLAGTTLPKRDAVDLRIVDEVRNGSARYEGASYKQEHAISDQSKMSGIIDSQTDVGGWPELKSSAPPTDTDHDGMPDVWERKNGLNPNSPDDRNKIAADGYTMLETYLNSIDSNRPR